MGFAQRNLLFGPRCSWTWALHGGERRWGAGGLRQQDLEPDALALYLAPAPATVDLVHLLLCDLEHLLLWDLGLFDLVCFSFFHLQNGRRWGLN